MGKQWKHLKKSTRLKASTSYKFSAHSALLKVWSSPEEHGLIHQDPATRCCIGRDPRLHFLALQEISSWIVRIHQTNDWCLLRIACFFPPRIAACTLVLPVLHFSGWIEAKFTLWSSTSQQINEFTCSISKDQLLFCLFSLRPEEVCHQPLQVLILPLWIMFHRRRTHHLLSHPALLRALQQILHRRQSWGHRAQGICGDAEVADQALHFVDVIPSMRLRTTTETRHSNAAASKESAKGTGPACSRNGGHGAFEIWLQGQLVNTFFRTNSSETILDTASKNWVFTTDDSLPARFWHRTRSTSTGFTFNPKARIQSLVSVPSEYYLHLFTIKIQYFPQLSPVNVSESCLFPPCQWEKHCHKHLQWLAVRSESRQSFRVWQGKRWSTSGAMGCPIWQCVKTLYPWWTSK